MGALDALESETGWRAANADVIVGPSAGSVIGTLTATGISWTGNLPVGATVTTTGTATVNNPDTGNKLLTSTLSTTAAGSNCPPGSTSSSCTATATVLIPGLTITNTANVSNATPGLAASYTVTIADTGQTSYTGISVADDLTSVLDDATYDNDAAATSGAVSFATPVLTWKLLRARPTKTVWGPLSAKGTDVAMEEMTLAYERLEMM